VINREKTEVMTFNIDHASSNSSGSGVHLSGVELTRVDNFRYLGSMMKSTTSDFESRRGLAWSAFASMERIWKAEHLDLALKLRIFQASVLSVLLYGCESWVINDQLMSKINSFATSCYRALLGVGRLDKIANNEILTRVGKPPLINTVRRRQLGWLGHVLRRDEREPVRIFALYIPEHGNPGRGKPPLTYLKQTASLLSSTPDQVTVDHIAKWANKRKEWHDRTAAYREEAQID
jgi:hypothetical protein